MIIFAMLLQAADPVAVEGIGTGALVFMLISMGAVATLTAWCFYQVLSTREHFDPDGTGPDRAPVPGEVDPGPGEARR